MDDTVLFLSAYNSTQYKATNWFLRKLRNVIPHKKKQMQSLLEKHHLSFVATDETITSVDGKMEVTAQYDYVHDTLVFSNNIENISDYFCKLIDTKAPAEPIKDISTVEIYQYYPQAGCSVVSDFDCDNFQPILYSAIILESLKLYIHIFQNSNLENETDLRRSVRNDIYLQNLFCSPNLPIETHNLLNYIKESEPYKKHAEALHLKISYLTAQNELKKSRNSAILNVLLYIISLLSAIGTLDVIEAHFGVPFKYSFIIVVTLFILGLFWGIIEYRNHRKL